MFRSNKILRLTTHNPLYFIVVKRIGLYLTLCLFDFTDSPVSVRSTFSKIDLNFSFGPIVKRFKGSEAPSKIKARGLYRRRLLK